jgi:DNA-binding transcriptional LysR family regulator
MDLRQLRYVVAVARHRNFTRAAAELLIAQPALSAQIRKLEAELQVRLFERTTRRVSLTPAGSVFVSRAERLLAEADAVRHEMVEHAGAVRGRVRIGAWYSVNRNFPELLAGFSRLHPLVDLTIREENSDVMLEMLRSGELDVAMLVIRDGLDFHGIERQIYQEEPFVLVTAVGSELARRDEVAIEELASTPLIVFKAGSAVRLVVERAFAVAGITPRIVVETAETSGARAFVSAGLGVALIPRSVTDRPGPPVAVVRVTPPPIRVSALAWRGAGGRPPSTEAFLDYARSRLGELAMPPPIVP